ncbi:MAG: CPBP family intramembrane metalloprotease [Holophagales bacterium]|nr:CPBP family intramembrane metalloprotease [Holophagales bacterium]MYC08801.1 CPBP family intramembrane metalloprotease [Holophagales bacterium]
MNPRTVSALVTNDLRQLARNPRLLVFAVALPLVMWPLMWYVTSLTTERRQERLESRTYLYAVAENPASADGATWLDRALARVGDDGRNGDADPEAGPAVLFERVAPPDDLPAALDDGRLHVHLAWEPGTEDGGAPRAVLTYRADLDASGTAEGYLRRALRSTRVEVREQRLAAAGFEADPADLLPVERIETASEEQTSGLLLGRILTAIIVLMMLTGGSIVATDALAGEKERGTLETLLTTAARRIEIVTAKNLSILSVALITSILNIANIVLWMQLDVIPAPEGLKLVIPVGTGLLLLFLYAPAAVLLSSALLLVSGRSKTYKEAQLLFAPVMLGALAIAAIPVLPGIALRSAIVVVPIANLGVAAREILTGTYDWPLLAAAWTVTAGAAALLARASVRTLSAEKLITASDTDAADLAGGPALFPRRVAGWFAVLWALLLVWQLNSGGGIDGRLLITINLSILGAAAWLMIARYRLPLRETLSLKPPPAAAWLGVLIAAPAGLVLANGVVRLASLAMPIPEEWLEAMADAFGADLPLWQMLFFFAVLPGIFEEIAFRGVLLHGLRARLNPVPLVLIAGIAFGFFHVDLFRIPPTSLLGVFLVIAVLRTGSVYPAMAWHALHNALALSGARIEQIGLTEEPAWWHYALALAAILLAFRLMSRPKVS